MEKWRYDFYTPKEVKARNKLKKDYDHRLRLKKLRTKTINQMATL